MSHAIWQKELVLDLVLERLWNITWRPGQIHANPLLANSDRRWARRTVELWNIDDPGHWCFTLMAAASGPADAMLRRSQSGRNGYQCRTRSQDPQFVPERGAR